MYDSGDTALGFFVFLIVLGVIGLIPAAIASGKGRSFGAWWVYGTLLWIVALVHSLLLTPARTCPHCAEQIKPEAKVCPHCQRDLPEAERLGRCRCCRAYNQASSRLCETCGAVRPLNGETI
jgi:Double zinc ribbon